MVIAISEQLEKKKMANCNKMFYGKVAKIEKDYNEMKKNMLTSNNKVQNSFSKIDEDNMAEKKKNSYRLQ